MNSLCIWFKQQEYVEIGLTEGICLSCLRENSCYVKMAIKIIGDWVPFIFSSDLSIVIFLLDVLHAWSVCVWESA